MAFGVRTSCLSSFAPSTSQKRKLFFSDILTIHNYEISCGKRVLDIFCVFFTVLFGGAWGTTCSCSFPASAAEKWKFAKLIFDVF